MGLENFAQKLIPRLAHHQRPMGETVEKHFKYPPFAIKQLDSHIQNTLEMPASHRTACQNLQLLHEKFECDS
jgi:hypothetical protein